MPPSSHCCRQPLLRLRLRPGAGPAHPATPPHAVRVLPPKPRAGILPRRRVAAIPQVLSATLLCYILLNRSSTNINTTNCSNCNHSHRPTNHIQVGPKPPTINLTTPQTLPPWPLKSRFTHQLLFLLSRQPVSHRPQTSSRPHVSAAAHPSATELLLRYSRPANPGMLVAAVYPALAPCLARPSAQALRAARVSCVCLRSKRRRMLSTLCFL